MNREEAIMFLSEDHCGKCENRGYFSSTVNVLKHIDKVNRCFAECEIGQKLGEAILAYAGAEQKGIRNDN